MENASKALIIAGAILITIIVISMAVLTFTKFGESAKEFSNMDEQEIAAFNNKVKPYIHKNVAGSQVVALITYAKSVNQSAYTSGNRDKHIDIYLGSGTSNTIIKLGNDGVEGNGVASIQTNKYYTVEGKYDSNGLITEIHVTEN